MASPLLLHAYRGNAMMMASHALVPWDIIAANRRLVAKPQTIQRDGGSVRGAYPAIALQPHQMFFQFINQMLKQHTPQPPTLKNPDRRQY